MPYYDIDPKWIKEKFGVEVTAPRNATQMAAHNVAGEPPCNPDGFFA